MESHSRGLRLRTAHPIRFPGTPSPKGTSFRDESVENSTAGYGKTSMREFYTVSAARFRNADRPACAPDPPGVRDISGPSCGDRASATPSSSPAPFPSVPPNDPGKRASQWLPDRRERNAGTRRPHSTVSRYVASGKLPTRKPPHSGDKRPPDPEFSPRAGKRSGSAPDRKAGRTTGSRRARKQERQAFFPHGPSPARCHRIRKIMQVAFPVRPILDRHQIELRIRIEAVERDIMLGGPHQRRELAGRHRLLGRRERAAPAALDLDDMEHALAQSHDVEFVTPAAPISM